MPRPRPNMLAHISAYFVRRFIYGIYGILSDKGNIGMKPAYKFKINILKKMRTKIMDKMRSEMPFMDEFGMVEAFATFPHG